MHFLYGMPMPYTPSYPFIAMQLLDDTPLSCQLWTPQEVSFDRELHRTFFLQS